MAKRVTLILDDDIMKKLRLLQAKMIKNTTTHVSFSKIVNETLRKSL